MDCLILTKYPKEAYSLQLLIEKISNYKCIITHSRHFMEHKKKYFLVKIFVGNLNPAAIQHIQSEYTIFIPNIYELEEYDATKVKYIDYVLCKNKLGYDIYSKISLRREIVYTKYFSDVQNLVMQKDMGLVGHLADLDTSLGTLSLLKTWIDNKGFLDTNPDCKLFVYKKIVENNAFDKELSVFLQKYNFTPSNTFYKNGKKYMNIYLYDNLTPFELNFIQNKIGLFVYPSLYQNDCKNIYDTRVLQSRILTTNAPPMNEMITDATYLIDVEETKKLEDVIDSTYLYKKSNLLVYYINPNSLSTKIKQCLETKEITETYNEEDYNKEDYNYFIDAFSNVFHTIQHKKKSTGQIFNDIYKYQVWNIKQNPLSGTGSTLKATKETISILSSIIDKYQVTSLYDCACGDMTWMPLLLEMKPNLKYYGGDVSEYIIGINKKRKDLEKHSFQVIDFTKDQIPKVDLILCRDVLQNINNDLAIKGLQNI